MLLEFKFRTVSSTTTPLKPLNSQVMGVSELTLPEMATTNGNIDSESNNLAENSKQHKNSKFLINPIGLRLY